MHPGLFFLVVWGFIVVLLFQSFEAHLFPDIGSQKSPQSQLLSGTWCLYLVIHSPLRPPLKILTENLTSRPSSLVEEQPEN